MKCGTKGCKASTYHLSTVHQHPFGSMSAEMRQMWTLIKQYKCTNGHITQQTIREARDLLTGAPLDKEKV